MKALECRVNLCALEDVQNKLRNENYFLLKPKLMDLQEAIDNPRWKL